MSARASIYYDSSHLRDVLLLEDVSASLAHEHPEQGNSPLAYSAVAKVQINLDDDQLVDDIVKALTRLQRDATTRRLQRDVARLHREHTQAVEARRMYHADWQRAVEDERSLFSQLTAAQTALNKITFPEGS